MEVVVAEVVVVEAGPLLLPAEALAPAEPEPCEPASPLPEPGPPVPAEAEAEAEEVDAGPNVRPWPGETSVVQPNTTRRVGASLHAAD